MKNSELLNENITNYSKVNSGNNFKTYIIESSHNKYFLKDIKKIK